MGLTMTAPLQEPTSRIRMPIHRQARSSKDICRLYFDPDLQDVTPDGDYELRGAVAWPMPILTPHGMEVAGCALAIATNIETRVSLVLSERMFRSVEHVFGNSLTGPGHEGVLEPANRGLHEWLSEMATKLGLNTYYYSEHYDVHSRWLQQINRCASLLVKPRFFEAAEMPEDAALAGVYSRIASGHLKYRLQGLCWTALATNAGHAAGGSIGKAPTDPVLKALSAASRSIAAWPSRVDQPSF